MTFFKLSVSIAFTILSAFSYGQKPELIVPVGHSDRITYLSFSPDNKNLITSSLDGTLKIWDIGTGKLLRTILHPSRVMAAYYSSDGKRILTASRTTVYIWNAIDGTLITKIDGHANFVAVNGLFSSDSKNILTTGDTTVKVWDNDGRFVKKLDVHTMLLSLNYEFSADRNIIVTVKDSAVSVWSMRAGTQITQIISDKNIAEIEISPDNKFVLGICYADSSVRIWNLENGKLILKLRGHTNEVNSGTYSIDGRLIATASDDGTTKIWNSKTGALVQTIPANSQIIRFVDDKKVLTSQGSSAVIWDIESARKLIEISTTTGITKISFNSDKTVFATATENGSAILWRTSTGENIQAFDGKADKFNPEAEFGNNGNNILTTSFPSKIMDATTGVVIKTFERVYGAHYSSDRKFIVGPIKGIDSLYVFDAASFAIVNRFFSVDSYNRYTRLYSSVSPDGNNIACRTGQNYVAISDLRSGIQKHLLNVSTTSARITAMGFSPNGLYFFTTSDTLVNVWDALTGKIIRSIPVIRRFNFFYAAINPKNKTLFIADFDSTEVRDIATGHLLSKFPGWAKSFSPDGSRIVTQIKNTAKEWDIANNRLTMTFKEMGASLWGLWYNEDGTRILAIDGEGKAQVYDCSTGTAITRFAIRNSSNGPVIDIDWKGNKMIVCSAEGRLSIYDLTTGDQLLTWMFLDKKDWVVTHSSGLFDASPGAMEKLYFVSNLDIIGLEQLKARYYEPGLWKKVFSKQQLRIIPPFETVELPPDIQVNSVDPKGNLHIKVTNRGGGIGQVTLYINGKEVSKDLRLPSDNPNADHLDFDIAVAENKNLIAGEENLLAVKAWNQTQWIESRSTVVRYNSPDGSSIKPSIYIMVCGISNYTGAELDLKYAAKDANQIANALQMGAKNLFGTDKCYVYKLTTDNNERYPTKSNILNTLDSIALKATSSDVFLLYLSGHGINLGGAEGDFYYLTQDAYTSNSSAYNDPAIRSQTTLSSRELVELLTKIPALKQVLIIDACASGKVVDNLMAKRDVASETLRALDRMKDRAGVHIITGCTADAVSYEASRYGQGVLTYSLLEGLRGQALRDNKFVDVNKLFQFSQERVPSLAVGIGGIQTPQVFSPNGSQSFDLGELSIDDRKRIPIAEARPVYIRSNFNDEENVRDILTLGKKMDEKLNETSSKGESSPLFFVDVSEYPEACQLSGLYKRTKNSITMRLNKSCGGKNEAFKISAKTEEELITKLLAISIN